MHDEAIALLRELLGVPAVARDPVPAGRRVACSSRTIPMNFLPPGGRADYVVTGAWGEKAHERGEDRRRSIVGAHASASPATTGKAEGKDKAYTRVAAPGRGRSSIRTRPTCT